MEGTTGQNSSMGNTTASEFTSIQTAKSGLLSKINGTVCTLELKNVSPQTILFSDRPDRIVETVSTDDFIGNWTVGQNSFAADAPNDVLIVEDALTGELKTFIIESFNPVYEINTKTLTYTITGENGIAISLPGQLGPSILVIDTTEERVEEVLNKLRPFN